MGFAVAATVESSRMATLRMVSDPQRGVGVGLGDRPVEADALAGGLAGVVGVGVDLLLRAARGAELQFRVPAAELFLDRHRLHEDQTLPAGAGRLHPVVEAPDQ